MRKFTVQPSKPIKCFTNPWDMDDEALEEYENEGKRYVELESKMVPDIDGFMTDYTMYRDTVTGNYVFVFGDKDVYRPQDGSFDWECDSEEEAYDWFYDYSGIADDDIESSTSTIEMTYEGYICPPGPMYLIKDIGHLPEDVVVNDYTYEGDSYIVELDRELSQYELDMYNASPFKYYNNYSDPAESCVHIAGSDDISTDSEGDHFTPDEPLSIDGFMDMFEIMVDLDIREKAAEILYRWYTLEGQDTMPTREDVLDMCDAATNEDEKSIVLVALDEM